VTQVLDTAARFVAAFYRVVGTTTSDTALTENGETANDVAYLCLTHGCWAAQNWLIDKGMSGRWRGRSTAIAWSGTDATTGGKYWALPTNFLRLSKDQRTPCLVEANGDAWGTLVTEQDDQLRGNGYYLKDDKLWLLRTASPPTTLYMDYIERHAEFAAALAAFDFPVDARPLVVALAAEYGAMDGWFPRADSAAIEKSVRYWKAQARSVARQSRDPRTFRVAPNFGRYIV
jgi:hypothetical protein